MAKADDRWSQSSAGPAAVKLQPSPYVSLGSELRLSNLGQLELLQGMMEQGASLRITMRGFSMAPFLRDRDVVTVEPMDGCEPSVGEVVAFTLASTGRLAVHRVVARTVEGWLIRGDTCQEADGVVGLSQILGRVVRVERNGRDVRLGTAVGGGWIAALNRGNGLMRLRALWYAPRRAASVALRGAQAFRLYRAVGRRRGPRIEIVEASEADREVVHRRLDSVEPYRRPSPDPNVTNWVAKHGGKIRGFVQLVRHPECDSPWRGYWLFSLMVWGRCRGFGIGETLIRRVIEQARDDGASELLLAVFEDNERAISLYRKLGFRPMVIEVLEPEFEAEKQQSGRRRIAMRKHLLADS